MSKPSCSYNWLVIILVRVEGQKFGYREFWQGNSMCLALLNFMKAVRQRHRTVILQKSLNNNNSKEAKMNTAKYLFEELRAVLWLLRWPLAVLGFLIGFIGAMLGWF